MLSLTLVLMVLAALSFSSSTAQAAAGINQQINFQGRLLNAAGATVPDGTYNIQFKIYQDGDGTVTGNTAGTPAGTLLWTESYANSATQGVTLKNGYFSVLLGSITSLSAVNFNSNTLFLSLNIGGTTTGVPTYDGEMLPMKRFAANPYALNSGLLGGYSSSQFLQLGTGNIQADASTGNSLSLNKTSATGNILDLQRGGQDVAIINNTGSVLFQPTANSTTALSVKNTAGTATVFTVDTTNQRIGINTAAPAYAVDAVGDINASASLKVGGVTVCTSTGCAASGGGGSYIQNQSATLQSANFAIQTASATTVGAVIAGVASQTADLLQLKDSAGIIVSKLNGSGKLTLGTIGTTGTVYSGSLVVADGTLDGFGATLNTNTLTANQTISLPNASGTICLTSGNCPTASGSGSYVQNTTTQQASSNFNISGTGVATTLNASTALQTGGTQRLDASGNLSNIGTYSGSGNITTTGGVLSIQGTGANYVAGNLGVGVTVPSYKLDVSGDINTSATIRTGGTQRLDASGNLSNIGTYTGSGTITTTGDLLTGNQYTRSFTRTLPTIVGNEVDLGAFTFTNGGANLQLSITVPSTNYSDAKQYHVPIVYSGTSGWQIAQPLADNGGYVGNNYALDINISTNTASLRLRRTAGTTAGTAYITLVQQGVASDVWTPSTATSAVAAPTAYYSNAVLTEGAGAYGGGVAAYGNLAVTAGGTFSVNGTTVFNGTGILQSAALSGTYSNAVTLNNASNSFTGNGAGLTSLNAGNITTGTLATAQGGTGATSYNAYGVVYANSGATALTSLLNGTTGQCLGATTSAAPSWVSCSAGATLQGDYNNSTSPQITLNATGAGLLIRDNTTPIGGNLFAVQNNAGTTSYLSVTATGTTVANGITVNGSSTLNGAVSGVTTLNTSGNAAIGGTLTSGTVNGQTIGSSSTFSNVAIQGSTGLFLGVAGSVAGTQTFANTTNSFTSNVKATAPTTGNNIFQLPGLATGTYNICTDAGNCLGAGVTIQAAYNNTAAGTPSIVLNSTNSTLRITDAATALGTNLLAVQSNGSGTTYFGVSAAGTTITNGLNLSNSGITNGGSIGGSSLSVTGAASVGSTLTVTGAINGQTIGSTSTLTNLTVSGSQTIQGSNGLTLGVPSTTSGKLVIASGVSAFGVTIQPGTLTASRTLTLPDVSGTICTDSGNCNGAGASLQTGYNNSIGGTTPMILLDSSRKGVTIADNATPIGSALFQIQNSANSVQYFSVNTSGTSVGGALGVTGATTLSGTLAVTGASTLTGLATLNGGATVNGTTAVTGATTINTTGTATTTIGNTTGTTAVNINAGTGNINLGGNTTATGTITVQGTGSSSFVGNLGIGTTTPTQKLEVAGNIQLDQVAAPATAPTAAINATAGTLTGNYQYRVSYVTATGETETSTASNTVSPTAQQINLTAIPISANPAVTARKLYRTTSYGGNTQMQLVTTIANNTTTTYTDNLADTSLGAFENRVNTTGGILYNGTSKALVADNATTALGIGALSVNTGYYNTAVGISALQANTTGSWNTALGAQALQANSTGSNNTATGYASLQQNVTGANNTATGFIALTSNSTGSNNTATGFQALQLNTTSSNNTATGFQALQLNATGSNNTATGYASLQQNVTGANNTATGNYALQSNKSGGNNTASGLYALSANMTGGNNNAFGSTALGLNTTGNNNTASGFQALSSNTTGNNNTALGVNAGYNTAVTLATNSNSVFIGQGANTSVDGLTNVVALGYNAQATQSNQVVLGNSSITQTLLQGSVGIGTTTPGFKLDVQAGTGIVANFSGRVAGGNAVASNEFVTLGQSQTGFIQNGTTTQASANFNIQATSSTTVGTIGGIIRGAAGGQTADLLQLQNTAGAVIAKVDAFGGISAVTGNFSSALHAGSASQFNVDNSGNVNISGTYNGVGLGSTSNFGGTVTIQGSGGLTLGIAGSVTSNLKFANSTNSNLSNLTVIAPTTGNNTFQLPGLVAGTYNICTDSGNCNGAGSSLQTSYNNSVGGTTPMIFLDGTRKGVTIADNATPIGSALFQIQNSANSTQYLSVNTSGTSVGGTLGVTGATTLSGTLAVAGTSTLTGLATLNGGATVAGATNVTGATNVNTTGTATTTIGNTTGTTAVNINAGTGNINLGGNTTATGTITVQGTGSSSFVGNLGIGTTTPNQKLEVAGNIQLDQVAAPATAPTAAINATAGTLTGAYSYRVSYVTATGETETGSASNSVSPSAQQINLTAIPVSANVAVTARKIYRTTSGGDILLMKLVTTIANNTTTTYTDNLADTSLGVFENRVNSTGDIYYNGTSKALVVDNATTAVGLGALSVNTGYYNTAVGIGALQSNTTGNNNLAFGYIALQANTTGIQNTAFGSAALKANTTGTNNTASGNQSLQKNTTGGNNTASGVSALLSNVNGSYNTASGTSSLQGNSNGSYNTASGSFSLSSNAGGNFNTASGYAVLYDNTTGSNNTALGYNAGYNTGVILATNSNSVFIGQGSNTSVDGLTNAIALGYQAQATQSNQVVLGNSSITQTLLQGSVGIGTTTTNQKLEVAGNIQLDQVAAPTAPTAAINATAGTLTGAYSYRVSYVTASGETETGAVSNSVSPTAQQINLTAIPISANPSVTARKLYRTTSGGIGIKMKLVTTITNNTTTTYTDNLADTSLGAFENRVNTTGSILYNGTSKALIVDNATTAVGLGALSVNTGYSNTAVGINALQSNTTGFNNTSSGYYTLQANTTGFENTASGTKALQINTTGGDNTASGTYALQANSSGNNNTASGVYALTANNTGNDNTASGAYALQANSSGNNNTASGSYALLNTTSGNNTASGYSSLQSNTTGASNTALGYQAGYNTGVILATNSNSVFIGQGSNTSVDGLTNAIALGYQAQATQSNQVVLGNSSITQTLLQGSVLAKTAVNSAAAFSVQSSTAAIGLVVSTNNLAVGYNTANATLKVGQDSVTLRSINAAGSINANGADYAEYIPWSGTKPATGSIVNYKGSNYIVSSNETAAFIGNDSINSNDKILVTFAGQVPVLVTGAVKIGDILISNNDGTAKAVAPGNASVNELLSKLAIAQETNQITTVKLVKASIGTTSDSMATALQSQTNTYTGLNILGAATIANLNVSGNTTLSNLTVNGSVSIQDTLTVRTIHVDTLVVSGKITSRGTAPQITFGVAAGSSTSKQIAPSSSVDGTDTAGTITVTSGQTITKTGILAELTFAQAYEQGTSFKVALTPTNDKALDIRVYVQKTANGFQIMTRDNVVAGAAYSFDYIVIGAQP